ncbi:MAG: tetratricopeptide repeat protein [Nostoc sp.]|uniref:tetratricopeptide repeat protein n=1 Tax=Nostoc sp. TaxID=1180 RepID=UPI002FF6BF9C
MKPDDHNVWNNRGVALRNLGKFEQAIASYDNALKIKPDFHETWLNRGYALDDLGRCPKMRSHLGTTPSKSNPTFT